MVPQSHQKLESKKYRKLILMFIPPEMSPRFTSLWDYAPLHVIWFHESSIVLLCNTLKELKPSRKCSGWVENKSLLPLIHGLSTRLHRCLKWCLYEACNACFSGPWGDEKIVFLALWFNCQPSHAADLFMRCLKRTPPASSICPFRLMVLNSILVMNFLRAGSRIDLTYWMRHIYGRLRVNDADNF